MPTALALARETLRGPELVLRPAALDDVPWVTRLLTERDPAEPADEGSIRHSWRMRDADRVQDRWVVEGSGTPIGFSYHERPSWSIAPMRASRIAEWLPRDALRPERLAR